MNENNEITIEPIETIPRINRVKRGKYKELIDEFIKNNIEYAKVIFKNQTVLSVINAFRYTIKKHNLQNMIKVMKRGNEVFLVRKDIGGGEDG